MAIILCIEDELAIRTNIVEELRDAGHKALQAGNGLEGLRLVKDQKPDLVLCDITLPKMNGCDLLTEIRTNHSDLCDIPFVFLTCLSDRQDILDGYALGADDYLTKPIDFEVLRARIAAILRLVGRMQKKKQNEQVKLYRAFSEQLAQQQKLQQPAPATTQSTQLEALGKESPPDSKQTREQDKASSATDMAAKPTESEPTLNTAAAKSDAKMAVGRVLVEEIAVRFQPRMEPESREGRRLSRQSLPDGRWGAERGRPCQETPGNRHHGGDKDRRTSGGDGKRARRYDDHSVGVRRNPAWTEARHLRQLAPIATGRAAATLDDRNCSLGRAGKQ